MTITKGITSITMEGIFNKDKYKPILNDENWYFTMGDTLEIY